MPADKPCESAIVKKAPFIISRLGSPNDTFETPSEVLHFKFSVINFIAFKVSTALFLSALIVRARGSNIKSFFDMPYSLARFKIFSAIFTLPSALLGIPFSSSVKQTTKPPYFFTSGKIADMLSSLPFTEFIIALPLYLRKALSIAVTLEVSICKGKSIIA